MCPGLLTGGFTVLGVFIGLAGSWVLRGREEAFTLRMGTAERLAQRYADLLRAAWIMDDATGIDSWTKQYLEEGEKQAIQQGERGLTLLALEEDTEDIRSIYKNITVAFGSWKRAQGSFLEHHDRNSESSQQDVVAASKETQQRHESIRADTNQLESHMQSHLSSLRTSGHSWYQFWKRH